jgi:hypothetical protein
MATEADGLRPCPFCGGEAEWEIVTTKNHPRPFYFAGCRACGFEWGNRNAEYVRMWWNRRDGDKCAAECVIKRALTEFVAGVGDPIEGVSADGE